MEFMTIDATDRTHVSLLLHDMGDCRLIGVDVGPTCRAS